VAALRVALEEMRQQRDAPAAAAAADQRCCCCSLLVCSAVHPNPSNPSALPNKRNFKHPTPSRPPLLPPSQMNVTLQNLMLQTSNCSACETRARAHRCACSVAGVAPGLCYPTPPPTITIILSTPCPSPFPINYSNVTPSPPPPSRGQALEFF